MSSFHFRPSYRTYALEGAANTVTRTFTPDVSGTKIYRTNSGGFRGQEFRPEAKRNLFVFGCSMTQGTGLNEEEIWCHHVHRDYCASLGLNSEDVNLMNFGMSGASNQEIARTVLLQCSALPPDLALVQFTYPERYEIVDKDGVMFVGPWSVTAEWLPDEYKEAAADHYRHYNHEEGAMELIKSILMVQHFFEAKGIPGLAIVAIPPKAISRAVIALYRLIDRRRMLWLPSRMRQLERRKEFFSEQEKKAADDLHYGPTVHKKAAEMVWRRCVENGV